MTLLSRRTILGAMALLPGSAALQRAIAGPEAPETAPPLPMHPLARLHALHDELSELVGAHNQRFGGKWEMRVRAPDDDYPAIVYMNVGSIAPLDRLAMARREFIEATKALHNDVEDWTIRDVDHSDEAPGFFVILGKRKAVRA